MVWFGELSTLRIVLDLVDDDVKEVEVLVNVLCRSFMGDFGFNQAKSSF